MEIEETCVSKNFDETLRLQSHKRREWIREIRGERPQRIAEGASSAPRLASSSSASFPERNECPGTHCSLIKQEEREDSSCQICHRVCGKRKDGGEDRVVRTERESDRRRREERWQTCWCCQDQQRACRMVQASAEKLGLLRRREWSWCHRESSWQVRQSRLYQKQKEQSRLSRVPNPEGKRESRWARGAPWQERERSEREQGEKRVESTVKEGEFQGGKAGQARRVFLREAEGSTSGWLDAKALQDNQQSLGFTPSLAKPEMEKKVRRRRARSQDERVKWVRVTRRGDREASEKRSEIGEDERQPVMARLAGLSRRSNLVILVTGPREGQQPFRPNPNGVGDRTTTLRLLLIGAGHRHLFT